MSEEIEIDSAVMALGKQKYMLCMGCHGANGEGGPAGPPLANSEWVVGPVENLALIQFRGLKGPITVNGVEYNFPAGMYPLGAAMTDEDIAATLTYVRNSFGNSASAVTPEMIAPYRQEMGKPQLTVEELIDPFQAQVVVAKDEPAPVLAEIPSTGLGASTAGIVITLVIAGLSFLGAIRMKATNR